MNTQAARSKAITTARDLKDRDPVFLDTETTGIGPRAEIVEIAILSSEGNTLLNTLVKPVNPIPPDAVRIHGITNDEVQDALSWREIWPQVASILSGRVIGIYNAEYDLRLMQQSHSLHQMKWDGAFDSFCVMKLFAEFAGEWNDYRQSFRWFSLEKAAGFCGIPLPTLHRAEADTSLTVSVFDHIARSTPALF